MVGSERPESRPRMPKVVDQEQQRLQLAEAAIRVIERSGIQGATVRAVAREAGVSRGLLAHYFENHRELIGAAMNAMVRESVNYVRGKMDQSAEDPGGVPTFLQALSSVEASNKVSSVAMLRLWAESAIDPELRHLMAKSYVELHREALQVVEEGMKRGEIDASLEPGEVADLLVTLGDGLCIARTLRLKHMNRNRVKKLEHLASSLLRPSD
jgi:DNA-binding transcriptional regulator YbjK